MLIFSYIYKRTEPLIQTIKYTMEESKKLFLLDAYALIYRAYYAFIKNPRMNSKGQNTSAIFGFVNTLDDLLKRENPTHIAVAFDPPGPTFRHEAYEHYKAQREETPEVIRWSVPYIKKIIEAYRIPILEVSGFEADDVIGTIARKAEKKGYTVYMMTPDKDYGQLVGERVWMYKPKYGSTECEVLKSEDIKSKYRLSNTRQMIDYLALVGDSSDNIPGCPGIGDVTAGKILAEFQNIDNVLEHVDKLTGSVKEKISKNKELILFSRFLATIRTDVPIDFDEGRLVRESVDGGVLKELFETLEFRTLINRITHNTESSPFSAKNKPEQKNAATIKTVLHGQTSLWDNLDISEEKNTSKDTFFSSNNQDHAIHSNLKRLKDVPHSYYFVDNEEKMAEFLTKISEQNFFCFDTETTGINAMTAELVGMSFCWEKNNAYYIPFPEDQRACAEKLMKLKTAMENPSVEKIGQNIKYDCVVLKKYGINVSGPFFDTMVAHYLLQPELRHNMDYLAEIYLNYQTIHIEELIGLKGKNQKSMRDVPPYLVCDYAAEDADITLQLKTILESHIRENNLQDLCYNIEMPLIEVLTEMETTGVSINRDSLKLASENMTYTLNALEQEIQTIAGVSFNVNSPKQIGEILFEKLEIAGKAKKTKTGQYSTTEEVLELLKSKHPIVEKVLEQRGLKKLLSTYIDALPQLIHPVTGKIHTSFNQTVTSTGRLSSSNPNLQNIPIRETMGREIRRTFAAGSGTIFLSADYSQIELRLMAHFSKDSSMINAFCNEQDIHAATAAKIYNLPLENVTPDMRRKAKTANFGIIYGISTFGLAERMGVTRSEAKELIDGYFESYPGIRSYMDRVVSNAREKGWVETLFHRKRYLPDILSQNANVRGYAERNAINAPIQGTAADIIKVAMVHIHRSIKEKGLKTKMILQVHDELDFIVPENELEEFKKLVIEKMENAASLDVPLKVDVGCGKNWLEAHA